MVIYARAASRIFGPLRCFTLTRKPSTVLIQCLVFQSSDSGVTKAVDKRQYYVGVASPSVFGGNLVLAKVLYKAEMHCQHKKKADIATIRGAQWSPLQ